MIIGKLSEYQNEETGEISYRGGISFSGVDLELRIVQNADRKNDNSPPWIVEDPNCGRFAEKGCGVGFKNTTQAGDAYIGLKINSSKLPGDLDCAMFPGREPGQHNVIWNRPRQVRQGEAA